METISLYEVKVGSQVLCNKITLVNQVVEWEVLVSVKYRQRIKETNRKPTLLNTNITSHYLSPTVPCSPALRPPDKPEFWGAEKKFAL